LHVQAGSAGSVTAAAGSIAVFENNGSAYIDVLVPDANVGGFRVGTPSDADEGVFLYNAPSTRWELNNKYFFTTAGLMGIGDTANANMTVGLTINQGANDNEILALKSSDVGHGVTGQTETDTYAFIKKWESTGGLYLRGVGAAATGVAVGAIATTPQTTDTSSTVGVTHFNPSKKSGTSNTVLGSTEVAFSVSDGSSTRMLLKGNGDMHITNTTLTALDGEDDIALVRAYQKESSSGIGIAMSKWDEGLKANRADLIRTGVWSSEGDFTVQQRMNDLLGGAIWQMNTKHMSLAEEVKSLKAEIKALTEGK